MLKKLITSIFLGLCLFASLEMSAAPAVPYPVTMKQPDGAEITIKLKGDETVNWMETLDGYSLMYGKDKYIVYAVQDENGDMVPSEVVFQEASLRSTELSDFLGRLKKGLRYSPSQVRIFQEIRKIEENAQSSSSSSPGLRATVGQAKAICALIGYQDKPFTRTVADFELLMNQAGYMLNGARGSVRDFYKENSYGKLDLIVTVVGPYTAANDMKYYGAKDGNRNDVNARALAQEAANFAFNSPGINPADYDNDGDGTIDTFHFIYAGYGQEAGGGDDCIWAHKWTFPSVLTFGTKRLSIYSCSPEFRNNSGSNITNIGVICHELCHVFGAPDYYDTNDATGGSFSGTGSWDLMAGGSWNGPSGNSGASPAHINMYQKIVFGWVTPTELTAETTVSGMLNSAENPVAYTVKTATEGEYFILENRQKVKFDEYLPGSGLLIYRVSASARGNTVSNTTHPQQVYPVCASSTVAIPNSEPASYGNINSAGCPFPGLSGNTAFSDYTVPSTRAWNGNNTSKPITGITEENRLISFSFMKSGAGVSNVKTNISGQNVTLSWDAPQGAAPSRYVIYRNGQTLITLAGSAKDYTQYNVAPGTYTYCVSALYGDIESTRQCAPVVTVIGSVTDAAPVKNLSISSVANRVKLSWSPDFDGGWISHAGAVKSNWKYSVRKFTIVSRWTVDDLKKMRGSTLTKVRFYPTVAASSCEYTVKVWSSSPNAYAPILISEQRVSSFSVASTTDVTLSTPVKFDDLDIEYWIGLECNITAADYINFYPAASDGGPAVPARNLVQTSTQWNSVSSDINWFLSGFLEVPALKTTETTGSWVTPSVELSPQPLQEETLPAYSKEIPTEELLPTDQLRSAALSGYKVYRDGNLLATVKTTEYFDFPTVSGDYVYCVSAVYGSSESEQVCESATTVAVPAKLPPVNDLLVGVEESTVSLTWKKPDERGKEIRYSSLVRSGTLGNASSGLNLIMAIRYAVGELESQNGTKLTKVRFIPGHIGSSYSICVWKGGTPAAPGELCIEQSVIPVAAGVWQEVVLNTPIELDIYEELWIGVRCISQAGQYPASYDDTPGVAGKGNMIYLNSRWSRTSEIAGVDRNWTIAGVLEPMQSFSSYGVYRDGNLLTQTNNLSYTQSSVAAGEYLYEVSALYSGGNESSKESVNVSVTYLGMDKVLEGNIVNIFPNPVSRGGILTIDLGVESTSAEALFYNISGQMVKKESLRNKTTQSNIDLPAGTYLMQVRLENGKVNTLKLIVN